MYVYFDQNGTLKEIISEKSFRAGDSKRDKIYVYWEGEHAPISGWVKYRKPNGKEYPVSIEECFYQLGDNLVGKALPSKPLRNLKYFSYDHTYKENGETHIGYKFYEIVVPDAVLNSSIDDEEVPTENNMVVARIRFVMDENNNGKIDEADSIEAMGALVFSVETNIGILTDSSINETQYNYLISLIGLKLETNVKSEKVAELPSEGVAGTIYYVESDESGIIYDAYFWNGEEFVFLGTTSYGLYTKQEGDEFETAIQALWNAELNDYKALMNSDFADYQAIINSQIDNLSSIIQAAASGSPKGTYATLTALQNAYPTGTSGIYVVLADGKWYYWNSSTTAWTAGGTYIANPYIGKKGISISGTDISIANNVLNNLALAINELGGKKTLTNGYWSADGAVVSNANYKHTEKVSANFLYSFTNTPHSVVTWLNGVCQGLKVWANVSQLGDYDEIAYNFYNDGGYPNDEEVYLNTNSELYNLIQNCVDEETFNSAIGTINGKFGGSLEVENGYWNAEGTIGSSNSYKHTEKIQANYLYNFLNTPHSVVTWLNGVCQGLKTWANIGQLGEFDEIGYNWLTTSTADQAYITSSYLYELILSLQEQVNDINAVVGTNYLKNKVIAVIGDSISTHGDTGTNSNAREIVIQSADVGVQLSGYLTYWDVYNWDDTPTGLTIGGHTFTAAEIGTEVTFTPIAQDVGKSIGRPNTYYGNTEKVWWTYLIEKYNCEVIPVCWSGASITSHEGDVSNKKTSYSWHPAQIRKCGKRTAGTMTRTAPDIIIVYRGVNDMTHSPYTVLTPNYGNNVSFEYPTTDELSTDTYGFKEGYVLLISKLREAYPNAQIVLCTLNVFKRVNYSHFPTNNGINTLPQYNDAIREIADLMGCGLIELDKDGITFENCYSGGYITDSATIPTHPSEKGQKVMGIKATKDLEKFFVPLDVIV